MRFLLNSSLIKLMKLKYPFLLGLTHFLIFGYYVVVGYSRNFNINIITVVLLLNISTYIFLALSFKKSIQHFIVFSAFSFITLVGSIILTSLFITFLRQSNSNLFYDLTLKYYSFAASIEKDYNNTSGFIKIIVSYILFALTPSLIVLSLSVKAKRKQSVKRRRKRKI